MNSVNSPFENEPDGSASDVHVDDGSDASSEQPGDDATGRSPKVTAAKVHVGMTTQDLRLAVTMSGGVSLAVWMGGIAREINLLQQASNSRVNEDSGASGRPSPDVDGAALPHDGSASVPDRDMDALSRDLYLALLKLLDLKVTVDVLSGTSAGGINAALLGLSSAAGVDLAGLRDLWLETGSMDALLRDPGEKNPPSLMQGDKVLFTGLDRGITRLYRAGRGDEMLAPPGDVQTTVFITTTMMSGETSRFTDDYGTLVPDVDHHGLFTFGQDALAPERADAPSLTALALAARSSASFPGAFEPSFVPINCQISGTQGIPERPDMSGFANMTRSHWAADGGLLANRPLTPLLTQMFAQPAKGPIRRVLAFVVPDGGGTPSPADLPPAAEWKQPLTMAGALKEDLGAQLAQGIASDQQAIRTHNEQITARHNLRRNLAEMGARLPSGTLVTSTLLRDYQQQQGASLAQPLLAEVMRQLTAMALPQEWAAELSPGRGANVAPLEPRMAEEMVKILGGGWKAAPSAGSAASPQAGDPAPGQVPASSQEATSEETVNEVAGELPETQKGAAWAAWDAATDVFVKAAAFGLPAFHAAQAAAAHLAQLGYQRAAEPEKRTAMTRHWMAIESVLPASTPAWDERNAVSRTLAWAAKTHPSPGGLVQVAAALADAKRRALLIGPLPPAAATNDRQPAPTGDGRPATAGDVKQAWGDLTDIVISVLKDLVPLATSDGRDSRTKAADVIGSYLEYFGGSSLRDFGVAPAKPEIADRLLNLVITERALKPAEPGADQPVEFVQVSANTRTSLAQNASKLPPLDTVGKLRGVELHHFAAFYKNSWRAYDWMWGRMDGSGWLVHILLDPRRILTVIEDHYSTWPQGQRAANFASLLRQKVGLPHNEEGDCLEEELGFLDDPTAPIPVSLPNSALFLARAWQELIAASELPVIAKQVLADSGRRPQLIDPRHTVDGDPPAPLTDRIRQKWHQQVTKRRNNQPQNGPPDQWSATVLRMSREKKEPAKIAEQLTDCPVRYETLAGQLHTPAFARTATKAAAVATAAIATAPETPGAIRPFLTATRTVTRTGYLATKVTGGTAWKTLLAGIVLAVLGGVMATQGMMVVGLTGTIVALAGLYLIAMGAWGIHRGLLGALIAIATLALTASLTLAWVRNQLWGSNGPVAKHILPWLNNNWWAGLALIGAILLLASVISVITRRRPRRNRGTPNAATTTPTASSTAMTAQITYDPATDDAHLHLADQSLPPGQTTTKAHSLPGPDAFITLDWLDNHLVGIEIHDAKRTLPTDLLHPAEWASTPNVGTSA
jgi:patatin-related protein